MIEKDGHTLVVGVVNKGYGCALPRLPGLYARVTSYTDWILDNVETRWDDIFYLTVYYLAEKTIYFLFLWHERIFYLFI